MQQSRIQKNRQCASQLLPIRRWPHGNSCTRTHVVRLHIVGTNEPKIAQQVNKSPSQARNIIKMVRSDL